MRKKSFATLPVILVSIAASAQTPASPSSCGGISATANEIRVEVLENATDQNAASAKLLADKAANADASVIAADSDDIGKLQDWQSKLETAQLHPECIIDAKPVDECPSCKLLAKATKEVADLETQLIEVNKQIEKKKLTHSQSFTQGRSQAVLKKELDEIDDLQKEYWTISKRLPVARQYKINQMLAVSKTDHRDELRSEDPLVSNRGANRNPAGFFTDGPNDSDGTPATPNNTVNSAVEAPH